MALQQAPASTTFKANFCTVEEQARYKRSIMKRKIKYIHTIKMANFFEAKFKYLGTFEEFGWMPYLTVQYPVHENLIHVSEGLDPSSITSPDLFNNLQVFL